MFDVTCLFEELVICAIKDESDWMFSFHVIMVIVFRHQKNEIELLFHMLRCFTARYLPQFLFFKEFLDETVAQVNYIGLRYVQMVRNKEGIWHCETNFWHWRGSH